MVGWRVFFGRFKKKKKEGERRERSYGVRETTRSLTRLGSVLASLELLAKLLY